MTPTVAPLPGRPRLFAAAGFATAFGSTVRVAQEGSPGPFEIPPDPILPPPPPVLSNISVPAAAVGGQGTLTEAEIGTLVASASAGVAFTVDLGGRRLRVKPSFEYLWHSVEATGAVQNASGVREVNQAGQIVQDFDFTSLHADKQESIHSIGGGLELELDTVRAGPFVLAIFLGGQVYQIVGDREIELFTTDGTNTASWNVRLEPTIYRGLVGLRFRFVPEP